MNIQPLILIPMLTIILCSKAAADENGLQYIDDHNYDLDGALVTGHYDVIIVSNANKSVCSYSDYNITAAVYDDDNNDVDYDICVESKLRWKVFRYLCCC
ncbi:hypothetical protein EWB00_004135 [Schistosoma japonicum]|uniref:Uncharacterized protein n=1 Tax=Schistosoma japonicum TaxID=6182 RepID=A0A4Z2D6B5_SCHJA|nr:hypothetical protein EWB00_004135 [Schistosoma japonicum]